jgi:WD40 repeat protein/transcriptional regulator with XRE-family HTH domain
LINCVHWHLAAAIDSPRTSETFRDLLLRHRGRTGLSQRDLAARTGVGRRTVQDWEAGTKHPTAERLQKLIEVLLEAGALTVGYEADEAHVLWAAALKDAPRMRTPFDEVWFADVLAARQPTRTGADSARPQRAEDWGDAPDVLGFVGRGQELATLREWIVDERCRVVAIRGMGGIGKTVLAAQLAQDVAPGFHRVYWRSLRNALPFSDWSAGAIRFLSDEQIVVPEDEAARLTLLVQLLREQRILLVLDNVDTLLRPNDPDGSFREGYAGYGSLLQTVAEVHHQSCLLVTSRETPARLAGLVGRTVRRLPLGGLGISESQLLLADKQLSGSMEDWASLVAKLGGNGLALKLIGEAIRELFGHQLRAFLDNQGTGTLFGGVRRLLAEQVDRSTALEHFVLRALAVEREPVTIADLMQTMAARVGQSAGLEAVEALVRRSLIERAETADGVTFRLQSVVLEYVTDRLVEEVSDEIAHGRPVLLVEQPLIRADAKDYLRVTQERLIGQPILQRLEAASGRAGVEQRLQTLLDEWRDRPAEIYGYGAGNVVNLLRLLRGDLRGLNLSRLALRQVYLAGVDAQGARLTGAHVSDAVLPDAFNFPISLALSGDGESLVAGTATGEVRVWRVKDRAPVLAVHGHTGVVWAVALSADQQLLASGSEDGTVRLWDVSHARSVATLLAGAGEIRCVALTPDGRLLASGAMDGSIGLWQVPGGRQLARLEGHTGAVYKVALSSDGRLLASAGVDGILRLWDPNAAQPIATVHAHTGGVRALALSGNGRLLASGGTDGTVRLWEGPSGRPLLTLQQQTAPVWSVALSQDARLLASGGLDGTVRLWESSSGQLLATLKDHMGGVRAVALSADGRLLASVGFDGTIRIWDSPGGRLLETMQGGANRVWGVASSADGRLLASGNEDGTVRIWEASTERLVATLEGHSGTVSSVAVSGDGRYLASGGFDGTLRFWNVSSGRLLRTLRGHTGGVRGIALSADGQLLASGSFDATIRLWESTGGLLATLRGHAGPVYGVALSTVAGLLASGSEDGTVRIWRIPSGHLLGTLKGHAGGVWGVALSMDGQLVASGGVDRTVRVWETATRRPLAVLQGHTGTVWGVALSGDGRMLASGSFDGTVRLWNPRGGQMLGILEGHTGMVVNVAFSADARQLVSSSFDGTVRVWDVTSDACLHMLRSDRRYERVDITGLTGVTEAQRGILLALGAVER